MPTSKETVPNRPLRGAELQTIILDDLGEMLKKDGMLANHIGYGRVCYKINLELQMDNPTYPVHRINVSSKHKTSYSEDNPTSTTIANHPLPQPVVEGRNVGIKRTRKIDNPNAERLHRGMPITVETVDTNTGRMVEKNVQYDKESAGDQIGGKNDKVTDEQTGDWEV